MGPLTYKHLSPYEQRLIPVASAVTEIGERSKRGPGEKLQSVSQSRIDGCKWRRVKEQEDGIQELIASNTRNDDPPFKNKHEYVTERLSTIGVFCP